MEGKAVALRSTHGAQQTFIDTQQAGAVFIFMHGDHKDRLVDGFTLTGGNAENRGGMYLFISSPSFLDSTIAYNTGNYNVYNNASYEGDPLCQCCVVHDPDGDAVYNLTLDDTSLTEAPGFLLPPTWDEGSGTWLLDDLHLALDSPCSTPAATGPTSTRRPRSGRLRQRNRPNNPIHCMAPRHGRIEHLCLASEEALNGKLEDEGPTFRIAPVPPQMVPKSFVSVGLHIC